MLHGRNIKDLRLKFFFLQEKVEARFLNAGFLMAETHCMQIGHDQIGTGQPSKKVAFHRMTLHSSRQYSPTPSWASYQIACGPPALTCASSTFNTVPEKHQHICFQKIIHEIVNSLLDKRMVASIITMSASEDKGRVAEGTAPGLHSCVRS